MRDEEILAKNYGTWGLLEYVDGRRPDEGTGMDESAEKGRGMASAY